MIDTHQHLTFHDRFNYGWIEDFPALKGDFGLDAYQAATTDTPISGSVFVEVDVDRPHSKAETQTVCSLSENPANQILGVVAAARPEESSFAEALEAIAHPAVKGIRRVLHTQSDDLSKNSLFRENLRFLTERNWSFDLCILQRQMPLGLDLIRACPEVRFMLDHAGVPAIADNDAPHGEGFKDWCRHIQALAAEPNCHVKLSGIPLYASEDQRTVEGLLPYVETLLEHFTPKRIVWGGDWPVCTLANPLVTWVQLTEALFTRIGLSPEARDAIYVANAQQFYQLGS
jgi:predicted TIM-barrel fold metal-dependent hydrolase